MENRFGFQVSFELLLFFVAESKCTVSAVFHTHTPVSSLSANSSYRHHHSVRQHAEHQCGRRTQWYLTRRALQQRRTNVCFPKSGRLRGRAYSTFWKGVGWFSPSATLIRPPRLCELTQQLIGFLVLSDNVVAAVSLGILLSDIDCITWVRRLPQLSMLLICLHSRKHISLYCYQD